MIAYGNPTDSRLFTATLSDGSTIDYYGAKDSNGLVGSISSVVLGRTNGSSTTATFTADGRPLTIHGSGGGSIMIEWSSPTAGTVPPCRRMEPRAWARLLSRLRPPQLPPR